MNTTDYMKTGSVRFPRFLLLLAQFASAPLAAQTCAPPPAGMVSWWPGDGNANDIAGQGLGTLRAGVTFVTGKVGNAFGFDGTGEVLVADNSSLDVQQLTMDAWVFPTNRDLARVSMILNKEFPTSPTSFTIQYEMGVRGNFDSTVGPIPAGEFVFFLGGIDGLPTGSHATYRSWVGSFGAVPLNTWTHVAVTFDGSTATAYVNGVATRVITGLTESIPVTAGSLKIGSRSDPFVATLPNERFIGRIDEVEIFNRALTAAEIQAIFNAGAAGKCKPPIPALTATPALDFGGVMLGQSRDLNVSIRNTGTGPLSVTSISSSSQQFRVVSPAVPFQVGVSGEQIAVIRFQPAAIGAQSASLTIISSDPARTTAAVALSGQGIAGPQVTTVSAAAFEAGASLAVGSIASAFGVGLAAGTETAAVIPLPTTLAGASVRIKDSATTERLAPLFFASPTQINFLIPDDIQVGLAIITVISQGQVVGTGTLQIDVVAPGLFTANSSGRGVAAALALRVGADDSRTIQFVFQCGPAAGSCVARPIDFGSETDQVFLLLFGTGIRGRSSLSTVTVTIGGEGVEILAAVPQGQFVGLDQVNVRLPRRLMGRGELDLVLSVFPEAGSPLSPESRKSNTVTINTGP